jgi:NhaP-type Na+/H+ or K+/H+ antiporter
MTITARSRAIIGCGIIACGVAAFFWWGTHFEVFGSDIDWVSKPEQLALPLLLMIGAFGAGFAVGGSRSGAKASLWTAVLFIAAAIIGIIRAAF